MSHRVRLNPSQKQRFALYIAFAIEVEGLTHEEQKEAYEAILRELTRFQPDAKDNNEGGLCYDAEILGQIPVTMTNWQKLWQQFQESEARLRERYTLHYAKIFGYKVDSKGECLEENDWVYVEFQPETKSLKATITSIMPEDIEITAPR